ERSICAFLTKPPASLTSRSITSRSLESSFEPPMRRSNVIHSGETETIPIPESFLTEAAAAITDLGELHVSLAAFRLADARGGWLEPVPEYALLRDRVLRKALKRDGSLREPDSAIRNGLDLAAGRGTLVTFATELGSDRRAWYFVGLPENRATVQAMVRG